jgi:hypothetical protein
MERTSMSWKTSSSRVVLRPATATISIGDNQPAIHSAALGLEGVRSMGGARGLVRRLKHNGEDVERGLVSANWRRLATAK